MIKNFIYYWPDASVIYIPVHKNASSFTGAFIEKLNDMNVDLHHRVMEVDLPISHETFSNIGGVENNNIISTKRNPYERLFSEFRFHGLRSMVKTLQDDGRFLDIEFAEEGEKYNFFLEDGNIIDDSFISDEQYIALLDKFIEQRCIATLWCPNDPHSLPQCYRWGSDRSNIIPNELITVENLKRELFKLYHALPIYDNDYKKKYSRYLQIYDEVLQESGQVNQTKKRFDTSFLLGKIKNKDLINFTYYWDFYYGGYKTL